MQYSPNVLEKIAKIKSSGLSNLHIIADFDRTLTVPGETMYHLLRQSDLLSDEYTKKSQESFDIYHPIEVDPTISYEVKCAKMTEWWEKAMALNVEQNMSKDDLIHISSQIRFRDGFKEFFGLLKNHEIPLLIFSAGLGDMIEASLESEKLLHELVYVVSNFFVFKEGKVVGYRSDIIHALNKNESHVLGTPYYDLIKAKKNVLLLGDTLEDVSMSHGLDHECVLKIGFLNPGRGTREDFAKVYDIVLEDKDLTPINTIIEEILG